MGITWSEVTYLDDKLGEMVSYSTKFPRDPALNQVIWQVWKSHKEALKRDGFGVYKANNEWRITCKVHHTRVHEFDGLAKKWGNVVETTRLQMTHIYDEIITSRRGK